MLLHLLLMVKGKPAQICAGRILPASLRYAPGPFQGRGICQRGAGYKETPGVLCRPGGIKKAARQTERQGIRGQCAAARSGSLLGRME